MKTPPDPLERELSQIPRAELPFELRGQILSVACPVSRSPWYVRWWEAVPKPVAVPIAAVWIVIAALRWTMPGADMPPPRQLSSESVSASASDHREMLVAWVERQKIFIHQP